MKKLFLSAILAVAMFVSCDKNDGKDNEVKMADPVFLAYCLENFDTDGDGTISDAEAKQVTEIEIVEMGISSLVSIELFVNLESLDCMDNKLTSLDLSKNLALTELFCEENQLTSLNVSKNTELKYLVCDNNTLSSLDVSKNTKLSFLGCPDNKLTSLDISKNKALTELSCSGNTLAKLTLSRNHALIDGELDYIQSQYPNLEIVYVD